uniref:Cupin domain-containing protein n=4 Tax=unclassified Prevotella TaxID=2638335 RepID=A0AB33J1W2_9BACT
MEKFSKLSVNESEPRTELHEQLGLTGSEISVNSMPAGAQVPFVHSHKQNEEVYGVLAGEAVMTLDGEDVVLKKGDWLRVSPDVKRQLRAATGGPVTFVCIQTKAGSLEGYTVDDAVIA